MVTFDPPVHRPSITNPFHIIMLDKNMVDMVWILGAWMVPSRLCVARSDTSHDPCPRLGQFYGKTSSEVRAGEAQGLRGARAHESYRAVYQKARAHDHDREHWHRHAGCARRDYCWCRSQPPGCHDRRRQSIAEKRRRILRVQPAVRHCRAHKHSRGARYSKWALTRRAVETYSCRRVARILGPKYMIFEPARSHAFRASEVTTIATPSAPRLQGFSERP